MPPEQPLGGPFEVSSDGGLSFVNSAFAKGNLPPVADAGFDRTVDVGAVVVLDASGSTDPKETAVTYSWSLVAIPAGSAASLDDAAAIKPRFTADLPGSYVAELVLTQGNRVSLPDQVTLSAVNSQPVAQAGDDIAAELGTQVTLDGSASWDFDGDELSYFWSLSSVPAGSAASLSDASAVMPEFFLDLAGTYVADLVVSDGTSSSALDQVVISTENVAPKARAGLSVPSVIGSHLKFDGSLSSDAEGEELAYSWALVGRPLLSFEELASPQDVRPTLFVDKAGTFVLQLTITDAQGEIARDTLTVTTENTPPVAGAGPDQSVALDDMVTLDGSSSIDVDGDLLAFRWALVAKPAGSLATLDDPTSLKPSFQVDLPGTYVAQVIADDGQEPSRPDTVVVSTGNLRPLAEAGDPQTVAIGQVVPLDAGASADPNGDPLSFLWSSIKQENGDQTAFSDPTIAAPTFTFTKFGDHVEQVEVSDGEVSAFDTVLLSTINSRPLAITGADQSPHPVAVVQLDGTGSFDFDANPLSYFWAITHKPEGSTAVLDDPTAALPSFTADLPGFYLVQLIVTESSVVHPLATPKSSLPATVLITGVNEAPLANAGLDQSVEVGSLVSLHGNGSSDPDGDALTFAWSIISAPAGSAAVLSDSTSATPSFTTDQPGAYVFELIVNDGFVNSAPDQVTITADPVTAQNEPPVLAAIGNQTLPLGSSLAIQMTATDLNGDPLTFGANPLPLPNNAALDAMSGLFTFTPDETQVGDLVLTFSVSDGLLSDSESVTISVTGPQPGGLTALSGRLLDTNDFVNGIETPIVGATVQLLGDTVTATSDANGDFTLSGIPSGNQVFDIDTGSAAPAPDGSGYAGFREKITLIADVDNVISRPFFLPRIDPTGAVPVDPAQMTVVDNTNLGVKLEIAANSARDEFGNLFFGKISISEVPDALAPAALPEELDPGLLITIQPVGITFNPPALITFPNVDAMPAGSELDIWSLDPNAGIFTVVGTGQVSPDGTEITTIAGGVVAADWHLASGPQNNSAPTGPEPDNGDRCQCTEEPTGSSTHVNSGNLQEEHATVAYRSFDELRNLSFRYNSLDADPRPILQMDATILFRSGMPNSVSTRLRVGGIEVTEELHTSTQAPVPLS